MRPTPRCVLLFTAGIAVAILGPLVSSGLWTLWVAFLGGTLLACGADFLLAPSHRRVTVGLDAPQALCIGDPAPLVARIAVRSMIPTVLEVRADLGASLRPQPAERLAVEAGGERRHEIPLVPLRRGEARIPAFWLRWSGPLGLLRRTRRIRCDLRVPVVPNLERVRQAALRFFTAREFRSGLKIERYVGDGSEFESLREYVPGLDPRAMNWKASARHRTLVCEEFRAERNHQVVLALDTGHLMAAPLDGIPKLDHAINAGLLLSYVCLRSGDRVGWFTFDHKVRSYVEPVGGAAGFRSLRLQTSAIEYSRAETNFTLGLMELSLRLRRRSLVVLLTDFVDTISAELMVENLARLSRRHLVFFVTLRDPSLERMAHARPASLDDLHRSVVAYGFVREREVVLRRLARLGVRCIDVPPGRVTTDLLNRYLEAKRRELV
jgi:uncharacterized protein (DUF58 family)